MDRSRGQGTEDVPGRRSPGQLENDICVAIGAAGPGGATVSAITDAVDDSLAYTTVVTTLGRLVERGVLSRTRSGRSYSYRIAENGGSVVATATARRMHRLLSASGDRSGALTQFVARLSPDDERYLADLLAELSPPAAGAPDGVAAAAPAVPDEAP